MSSIKTQVKLPLSVAMEVVLQGIRIRLERSIVTMTGVVLGIAFLMSILAGQTIQQGVAGEQEVRTAVKRMGSFLAAEVGPPKGRQFGVVVTAPPTVAESRFVRDLYAAGAIMQIRDLTGADTLADLQAPQQAANVGDQAHAILVLGDAPPSADFDWATAMANARNRIVATTGADQQLTAPTDCQLVQLHRKLRPEEIERIAADLRKSNFRRTWIIIISLLVTVICITNSMLMSVTERFREIGTMKCLGAMSSFIRRMFLIESGLVGTVGSVIGSLGGFAFSLMVYGLTYGFGLVMMSLNPVAVLVYLVICSCIGIVLSMLAALYPAQVAAKMVPAYALRSSI